MAKYTLEVPDGYRVLLSPSTLPALQDVTAALVPVVESPPPPIPEPPPTPPPLVGSIILTPLSEIQVGRPVRWFDPLRPSGLGSRTQPFEFVPLRVVRDQTITPSDNWGMALNGEDNRPDLSRTVYIRDVIRGGRYAVYFAGEQDVLFVDCTLDASPAAPTGLNEEAIVRLQDCRRIGFQGCTLLDATGPKHAWRAHKTGEDLVLANSRIATRGNGFYLGTYDGQSEQSRLARVSIMNVRADVAGPDKFNEGRTDPNDIQELRIRGLSINGQMLPDRA